MNRTYIKDAKTEEVYCGYEVLDGTLSKTFTLRQDTKVKLGVNVFPGAPYINGYSFRPQLMVGKSMPAEFIKPGMPPVVRELPTAEGGLPIRFEDIYAVYADKTQLIKSTLASGSIFNDTYYKDDGRLGLNLSKLPETLNIVYIVRPVLKTESNISSERVKVPVEFIDLVKAKLRGEAYKLANEDSLAAKWLNDYNVLLETFKEWHASKSPSFGL